MRVNYIAHEKRKQLPLSYFSPPWSKQESEDALCTWVAYLLKEGRFWAAQDVLEVCFRRAGRGTYRLDLKALWSAISSFVEPDTDPHEAALLAKMTVLQVYCEGLIRRGFDIFKLEYWEDGREKITTTEECLMEILGENVWKTSRPRLRLNLLDVDASVVNAMKAGKPQLDETGIQQLLEATLKQAYSNEDKSIYEGAKFRLAALMHAVNLSESSCPSTVTGPFPLRLYIRWQNQSLECSDRKVPGGLGAYLGGIRAKFTKMVSEVSSYRGSDKTITKSVLFMGDTRSGKSTMISTLTDAFVPTSESMTPCTSAIEKQTLRIGDVVVECYDTPGFGDSRVGLSIMDVLEQISRFLRDDFRKRQLQGVMFLIDISGKKLNKVARDELQILEAVLGEKAWRNTCIVFTNCYDEGTGPPGSKSRDLKRRENGRKAEWKRELPPAAKSSKYFDLGLDYSDADQLAKITDSTQAETSDQHDENTTTELPTPDNTEEPEDENAPDIEAGEPHQFRPVEKRKGIPIPNSM